MFPPNERRVTVHRQVNRISPVSTCLVGLLVRFPAWVIANPFELAQR